MLTGCVPETATRLKKQRVLKRPFKVAKKRLGTGALLNTYIEKGKYLLCYICKQKVFVIYFKNRAAQKLNQHKS